MRYSNVVEFTVGNRSTRAHSLKHISFSRLPSDVSPSRVTGGLFHCPLASSGYQRLLEGLQQSEQGIVDVERGHRQVGWKYSVIFDRSGKRTQIFLGIFLEGIPDNKEVGRGEIVPVDPQGLSTPLLEGYD